MHSMKHQDFNAKRFTFTPYKTLELIEINENTSKFFVNINMSNKPHA